MLTKNQDIRLTITALTNEGSGVGRYGGQAVFVSSAAVGDEIECHIIKAKKNYAVGKLTKIITPSPDRIEPDCPVYSRCGGCSYRHISYEAECRVKEQNIADSFKRIGSLDVTVKPIIPAVSCSRYRNKAQYPVRMNNGRLEIGFFAPFSHRVIDCADCKLQPGEFSDIISAFRTWITKYSIPVYDEQTHRGIIRHIYIRKAFETGEIVVTVVVNAKKVPKKDELITKILKSNENIVGICADYNTDKTNVIMSDKCECIWGREYIEDILCSVKIRISPLAFYQVNRAMAETLYKKAAEYAHLTPDAVLLDLYCGAGTIGLSMADKVKEVIGAEIIPEAVENAKTNAEINGIKNARFICADASAAAEALERENLKPDVVILDPPRKGCSKELIETVVKMNPDRVVYVSCDHATLARDCAVFDSLGYKTVEATPVDLFPRTVHVETVCLLSKLHANQHIEVELQMDELDLTAAESKATYEEIKEYVLKQSGLKVSNLYIAQVKQKCGIIERENYNLPKSENSRQPQCPPEKEKAIREAMKYFGMI